MDKLRVKEHTQTNSIIKTMERSKQDPKLQFWPHQELLGKQPGVS